jgi:hypothetical protein
MISELDLEWLGGFALISNAESDVIYPIGF